MVSVVLIIAYLFHWFATSDHAFVRRHENGVISVVRIELWYGLPPKTRKLLSR